MKGPKKHEGTRLQAVLADIRGRQTWPRVGPTHTHAQPKSVFSRAMTVMDKIERWKEEEDDEEMGWFQFRSVRVDLHKKAVICNGQGNTHECLMR